MRNPSATRLTREEFLGVIDNYRNHGRDTAALERSLREAFPGVPGNAISTLDERIAELRKQSPVTEGSCSVCGAAGTLYSGVCESCFLAWATKVAESNLIRATKSNIHIKSHKGGAKVDRAQEKRFQIIDLAIRRGWFIHPSKGMEGLVQTI